MDDYRSKRDFDQTPEPTPERSSTPSSRTDRGFVVHRHQARRLHYDLRLEMNGVLKCWAVPRGLSYDPKDKSLAVHTEDHPLEYEGFHGIIPKGQYGAGIMDIWDRGTYELTGKSDGEQGIRDGKLEFRLDGGRFRGEWHMVRLKDDPKNWLLFKTRDIYSRNRDDAVFDMVWVERASRMPKRAALMKPTRGAEPFSDPDWGFEVVFDGMRVQIRKEAESVRLLGLRNRDWLETFPNLRSSLLQIRATDVLMDAVLVALDSNQRPCHEALINAVDRGGSVALYAIDLLHFDRWDMKKLNYSDRKAALASLLPNSTQLLFGSYERERGIDLFQQVSKAGLPGLIAKRLESPYRARNSNDWKLIPVAQSPPVSGSLTKVLKPQKTATGPKSRRVQFTNMSKILWPQDGISKGDLIDYYHMVSQTMLPYLADRPLSLHRYPDGVRQDSFFQKNLPESVPEWITTESIPSDNRSEPIRYTICDNKETLLYLANLATIEIHPWSSRCESLDRPDWIVFDLDPSTPDLKPVIKLAQSLYRVMSDLELDSYLKTSGSRGLHVYLPIKNTYSYDQARIFSEAIGRWIVIQHRNIATVERSPNQREGKVYIDFLQNRRAQTVVAPYSVRPVQGARVSTPLKWSELNLKLDVNAFTIHTIKKRLDALGDLFAPVLNSQQDLSGAISAFETFLR